MRKDSPLAKKEKISPNDIKTIPLITSQQVLVRNEISGWSRLDFDKLNIVATYNLVYMLPSWLTKALDMHYVLIN